MFTLNNKQKIVIIAMVTLVTFLLQVMTVAVSLSYHESPAYLYFIAIILSGYWYGRRGGIFMGILTSAMAFFHSYLYLPSINLFGIIFRSSFFIVLGGVVGYLTEKEHLERQIVQTSHMDLVKVLSSTLDAKDSYTEGHSFRVASIAKRTGDILKLPKEDIQILYEASLFHDIGKIGIDDAILKKSGSLTPQEFEKIRAHPELGVKILKQVEYFQKFIIAVRHHHERFDGKGYPEGLSGEKIPLIARIITIADAYDAMTSQRPYRKPLTCDEAIAAIKNGSGTQFDPAVVNAFLSIAHEFKQVKEFSTDVDPVCKMKVDTKLSLGYEYNGKKYYFCSESCGEEFIAHPRNYI